MEIRDEELKRLLNEARRLLNNQASSEEDPRVKAIINIKLEEAELWLTKLNK